MASILVVDDRPINREFLTTLLGYGGHRLLEAADGAEALALAKTERPDLVIADILMPTMDGYELVRQLRADPAIAQTPVIFFTAHYHEQEAQSLARACGVSCVLTKPAEPEAVLRAVEAALGRAAPPAAPAIPEEFDREHLRLLTDKLAQKSNELKRSNERLAALIDLGLRLGSELDLRRLLQSFGHAARDIIGARYAITAILAGDGPGLQHVFTSGMDADMAARLGSPDPRAELLRPVLRDGCCARLHNSRGAAAIGLATSFPPVHAFLAAPIASPTRIYGWIGLIDKVGVDAFSDEDERLAGILGAQVGRIYQNGSLYADVLQHASDLEREMSERQHAEKAMRAAQQRLQHVIASSPAVLYTLAVEGENLFPTWISDNVHEMMGYTAEEVYQPNWWQERVHPEDIDRAWVEIRQKLFPDGRLAHEHRFRHQDGTYHWVQSDMRLQRDQAGQPTEVVGSWSDITERKQLEEQYRQAQKMEAVGRLAGGVAHDFNNLLTVIMGYSDLFLGTLRPEDPLRMPLAEIHKAGERAAGLTRQLLAFSRKQVLLPVVLNLNVVLAEMEKMLRRLIGEDVALTVLPGPELWPVKADPGQVEQVVMNIVVNARDAMPLGGKLLVETKNVELNERYTQTHTQIHAGDYVLLAISDTGSGMDAKVKARIFEPFFTTKGPTKGTGLGLATVFGIVKQSGGHIEVYSELGQGTAFKIYLPRDRSGDKTAPIARTAQPVRGGKETILLVEDEDSVRTLAKTVLERHGYKVIEARHGGEALLICETYSEPIDLLVTDVVMPHLSGRQLAQRLIALQPKMKVLYMSGYTDDAIIHHGVLDPGTAFVQKPFAPEALARKVRAVLDQIRATA